jgi:hypothetical protein
LSQKTIPHEARVPAQSPLHKQLTEKRKDGRLFHLSYQKKNFQSFAVICRKPHVASSICLRATSFQNPEWILLAHCIIRNSGFHCPLRKTRTIKQYTAFNDSFFIIPLLEYCNFLI